MVEDVFCYSFLASKPFQYVFLKLQDIFLCYFLVILLLLFFLCSSFAVYTEEILEEFSVHFTGSVFLLKNFSFVSFYYLFHFSILSLILLLKFTSVHVLFLQPNLKYSRSQFFSLISSLPYVFFYLYEITNYICFKCSLSSITFCLLIELIFHLMLLFYHLVSLRLIW